MHVVQIFFCTFISLPRVLSSLAPTHLLVTRVGPCYDILDTTVKVLEFSLLTKTYDSTLTGWLNISKDIDDGWTIKATMQKCQDIRNMDTCDYFKSFNVVKNGCKNESEDDQDVYAMLFHYTEPRLSCPLQAGTYNLLNYPIYTEVNHLTVSETKISTSVFGYTFTLDGYTENKQKILCVEAYLQLLYMREHNWLDNRHVKDTTPPPAQASSKDDKNDSEE